MRNRPLCTRCKFGSCIFQYRPDTRELVCGGCCQLEAEAGEGAPLVIYRALANLFERIDRKSVREQARTLVQHDRILVHHDRILRGGV